MNALKTAISHMASVNQTNKNSRYLRNGASRQASLVTYSYKLSWSLSGNLEMILNRVTDVFGVNSPEAVAFRANNVKLTEDGPTIIYGPTMSATEIQLKNAGF